MSVNNILKESLLARFKDLEHIGTGLCLTSTTEWSDHELEKRHFLDIKTIQDMDLHARVRILRAALSSLTIGVSTKSVGYILVGAFGLMSCKDPRHFCLQFPPMDSTPTDYEKLDDKIVYAAEESQEIPEPAEDDMQAWAKSASYLCAALLCLMVKDHENVIRAWDAIAKQYRNFYQEEIAIDIEVDSKCARGIRDMLQSMRILRDTVGVFLLAFQDTQGRDRELCRMLYELHMSYAGLHSYRLLLFCATRLQTPVQVLFTVLSNPTTKEALDTAAMLHTTYEMPLDDKTAEIAKRAKTWRYARIFNSNFCTTLQTKNCVTLTGILAHLAKDLGGSEDVTRIKQISNLPESTIAWMAEKAQKVKLDCLGAS